MNVIDDSTLTPDNERHFTDVGHAAGHLKISSHDAQYALESGHWVETPLGPARIRPVSKDDPLSGFGAMPAVFVDTDSGYKQRRRAELERELENLK